MGGVADTATKKNHLLLTVIFENGGNATKVPFPILYMKLFSLNKSYQRLAQWRTKTPIGKS